MTVYTDIKSMQKTLKMRTKDSKWIIENDGRNVIFDKSYDAWRYIFLMREIRPKVPQVPKSIYPVKSLNPFSWSGKKKITYKIGERI